MIEHNLSHQLCSRPDISTACIQTVAIIAATGVATLSCSALISVLNRIIVRFSVCISSMHSQLKQFVIWRRRNENMKKESAFNAFYSSKQYSESRALLRANESQASIELQPIKLSVI